MRFVFFVLICFCPLVASVDLRAADVVSWSRWRRLPVFDNGRVMPLDTFARQIVEEICGTPRPFICVDDTLISELEKIPNDTPVINVFDSSRPSTEEVGQVNTSGIDALFSRPSISHAAPELNVVEDEVISEQALSDRRVTYNDAQNIVKRIRYLIPNHGGRYFEPYEILLSWLVEPEIWEYLPFIKADDPNFRRRISVLQYNQAGYRLRFVTISQVRNSSRYQQTLERIAETLQNPLSGQSLTPEDRSVLSLEQSIETYKKLIFRPTDEFPALSLRLIQNTVEQTSDKIPSLALIPTSFEDLLTLASTRELTAASDIRATIQDTIQVTQSLPSFFRPRNQEGETVPFTSQTIAVIERQFEKLAVNADKLLAVSVSLMNQLYPEARYKLPINVTAYDRDALKELFISESTSSSLPRGVPQRNLPALRKHVIQFHYGVVAFRREVLAAYIALYDNGQSLRVLPSLCDSATSGDNNDQIIQPWVSLQTFLYASTPMMRRFIDSEYGMDLETTKKNSTDSNETDSNESDNNTPAISLNSSLNRNLNNSSNDEENGDDLINKIDDDLMNEDKEGGTTSDDESEMTGGAATGNGGGNAPDNTDDDNTQSGDTSPADDAFRRDVAAMSRQVNNSTERARIAFADIRSAYMQSGRDPLTDQPFSLASQKFEQALMETAERMRAERMSMAADDEKSQAVILKTDYPRKNGTAMEYRYTQLYPFFWMWLLSAVSVVLVLIAQVISIFRSEQLGESELMIGMRTGKIPVENPLKRWNVDNFSFWGAVLFLALAVLVTFVGGLMRAMITGWAPVTNMFETVVLMGFVAGVFGLWYCSSPLVSPIWGRCWRITAFPTWQHGLSFLANSNKHKGDDELNQMLSASKRNNPNAQQDAARADASEMISWNSMYAIPRLFLMIPAFLMTAQICYAEHDDASLFGAIGYVFSVQDPIDRLVVIGCIVLVTWFVPRILLALITIPFVLLRTDKIAADAGIVINEESIASNVSSGAMSLRQMAESQERALNESRDNPAGRLWFETVKEQMEGRKLFVLVGAVVMLLAGLSASFNSEFNPTIRPLMAVLRSNFWLAAHVTAIIVSYSAAAISWGLATIAIGCYIFGKYGHDVSKPGYPIVLPPTICVNLTPYILQMLRLSVLLLCVGTILGARWADYSWGRFWGWDPKEVWALITVCFFLLVLHGRLGKMYGTFGLIVGSALGSIPILLTWYGVSFVFRSGLHAYSGSEQSAGTTLMFVFIGINICWCFAAFFRYQAERLGSEADDE
ncbi:MAG: cytochrome c biogenesis protein CcsA [Planctomycetaceae bacterium]|nr:cytochrome c biogenesis protein CcsA [Planctomycetaceae bacterium]